MALDLPPVPATYVLILHLPQEHTIQVGRLGELLFREGHYLYVGSARGPGGLRARVARHMHRGKTAHWHIDYLRHWAELVEVWFAPSPTPLECRWREILEKTAGLSIPVFGFGSSDCRCPAHLLYNHERPMAATRRAVQQATDLPVHRFKPAQ